ncbi:hypothetical protein G6O67_005618 [Ophiocordyceps sinensis]|uniref:F-box domain-containing protein n=2 Tax=Ophiocordyceps sinensis TaxID=72228 RepID=A0A8H4PMW0_9HYPO|nr:F-box domain, cyclin-like protein [Ophiocordyceps sinensis CO18]KAF4506933.1 hypothetical protein G6O67_005618 [Ophiocordyceps sinensis]
MKKPSIPSNMGDITYRRMGMNDHTLDENLPVCPPAAPCQLPTTNAGVLDRLPLETLHEILFELDLRTLVALRRVNRRGRELVGSLPQWNAISKHARNALRGILALETGDHLQTSVREAMRQVRSGSTTIRVDYESALYAGISRHGSMAAMEKYVSDRQAKKQQAYEARVIAARKDRSTTLRTLRHLRRPAAVDPFDRESCNPWRFVAVSRVPWLQRPASEEWGFYCVGCEDGIERPFECRRLYTTESFLDHLAECGPVRITEEGGEHPGMG